MRLTITQLHYHLKKPLLPIYLVIGKEPLLVQECCDAIRHHSQQQGFHDRQTLRVTTGFDWQNLHTLTHSSSLLADKTCIELYLPHAKPGKTGSAAFVQYAQHPPKDTLLLVISDALTSAITRSQWYQTIEREGACIPIWPVKPHDLPRWITQRLASVDLQANTDAIQLLADHTQGHLLACAQAIEKLRLLVSTNSVVDANTMASLISNSARYTSFDLVDCAISGDAKNSLQILSTLRAEGVDSLIILSVLSREIRLLAQCAEQLERHIPWPQILQRQSVWKTRQNLVKTAVQRLPRQHLESLLQLANRIDYMIKGMAPGNVWDTLKDLVLGLANYQSLSNHLRNYQYQNHHEK